MHAISSTRTLLALPLLLLGAKTAGAMQEAHPILGDPLVINGETVPFEEIKRQVVFGPLGVEPIRLARLNVYIEQEIERQVEKGADPARFDVQQEDIDTAIAEAEKQVGDLYEGQEVELDTLYPTKDKAWLDNVKLTQRFNRVFLPDNPNNYPQTSIDALQAGAGTDGTSLYQHLVDDWQRRQDDPELPPDPVGTAMMAMITNQTVIKHLESTADIVTDADELEPGVMMKVNGVDIMIDDIWSAIENRVTDHEVEIAKRWIVNMRLIEESLHSTDHWISDEELEKAYQEYAAPYEGSPFSIETIALRFQKFPTLDSYKDYYRITLAMKDRIRYTMRNAILRKSSEELENEARAKAERLVAEGAEQSADELYEELFEELVQDYVDQRWDEQLVRTSATRTSRLAGDARLQVDIILISAYDFAFKRWKENGWEEAEKRTKKLVQDLADGMDWKDAVEQYSDFYDPPIPTGQAPQFTQNNKGRFRAISRNDLMKRLEESVFLGFVFGETITDYVFFEMPVGKIQDPIKGPYGYYVCKLYTRGGPKRMLDFENPDHRELIEQDFIAIRIEKLVKQLIEENEILGID